MKKVEELATQSLKMAARNEQMKHVVQRSTELYPLLWRAAKRYVTGERRQDAIAAAHTWLSENYQISIEFIGENTTNFFECQRAKDEFLQLIGEMGELALEQTISFDLSHIGLSISAELAYKHLEELAQKAQMYGITLMISMEESTKTDAILTLYKKIAPHYPNVGITIQVHLYRSEVDLQELIQYPGKIRLVKGAFQEPKYIAMARSKELNHRYLQYVEQLVNANHPIAIATHDNFLINELEQRQYLYKSNVEVEMLDGVQSELLKQLKTKNYCCRVYLTYGREWYLYLCHRIAEHPENVYLALTDMLQSSILGRSESD
ncbi:proline dehydrogenase family protein [Lysinibacillus macroides]|uniref:Proline dehydrogenase n=1 Tax=Lysinibacillus macroides TaxID=33935 RepID=A0A0M9DGE6_9BACI|nr:proline dehydrogenase family protein [Lysinibacillus macroides]KOY80339.1 proline dehydrogenase [Lysinibacillus macroides]QPR67649.1 proline dehydrogenase family protein [Lysinibacillus macroides]